VATVNELKCLALLNLTGRSQPVTVNELEAEWLSDFMLTGNVNEMWIKLFHSQGATSDNFNEAAYEYLTLLGCTQKALPEKWYCYWFNGGGGGLPDGVMLDAVGDFMIFADDDYAEYA